MATNLTFFRGIEDRYGLGSQILDFCNKLIKDPTNPSLHVEPIKNAADKRVRTARVTKKYRAVLFELRDGSDTMFVLVDILNHDDAYALATSKTLVVNEVSGVPSLVDATAAQAGSGLAKEEIESRAKRLAAEQLAAEAAKRDAEEAKAQSREEHTLVGGADSTAEATTLQRVESAQDTPAAVSYTHLRAHET